MVNEQIISYIKRARNLKVSDEKVKEELQKNGWNEAEIQEGIAQVSGKDAAPALIAPVKNPAISSHGMWDAFEHILLFINLYVMSSSIVIMLLFIIDEWLPSAVTEKGSTYSLNYYASLEENLLRTCIAALIVSLPLFLFFFLNITKRTLRDPSMRNIRARKVLIYITLILTFLTMLGFIISIIYITLEGIVELKDFVGLAAALAVNGVIFGYYMIQVKHDRREHA